MNKQEALQKIKELQEYIEDLDRPAVKRGQLYRHKDGDVYMVYNKNNVAKDNFDLVGVFEVEDGNEGFIWTSDGGFGESREDFTYIGMAKDLLTVNKP